MPLVPGRGLALALLLPLVAAAAAGQDRGLLGLVLGLDALVLGLALIDGLLALRGQVEVRRSAPPTASLGRAFPVELEVRSSLARPVRARVTEDLPPGAETEGLPAELTLAPGTVRRVRYHVRPGRRGPLRIAECWLRYPSPGGLWLRQLRRPLEDTVRIYPDVQAVRHWELHARADRSRAARLTRFRGGDTEFERLRDHQKDDEFRRIDWRATARRRRLTVREYQLEQNQNLIVMLDCGRSMMGAWHGRTALDHALNATLMLTHVAIRRGDNVGLLAFGERVERFLEPRGGRSASNHIIQATYDLFPAMVEPSHDEAFAVLRKRVRQRTLVVLVTHALDEPTAERLKGHCRELLPRHLPLVALLRDEALEGRLGDDPEVGLGARAAASELVLWRDRLSLEMQRAGVLVVDVFPRELTGALLARYLDVKARGLL
jgi:uncharacterized protein (DUF58 family)